MENKMLPVFLILCCILWEVNSISLEGPVLTTYRPCGLGFLRFDRISTNKWQGSIEIGLYDKYVEEAQIKMKFKNETTVLAPNVTGFNIKVMRTNKYNFKIYASYPIPEKYTFEVQLDHVGVNESDVPVVTELTLDDVTLCNEQIKEALNISSFNAQKYSENQNAHICGTKSLAHEELTSLRTEAKPGEWPWHVAIVIRNKYQNLSFDCGGTIVSKTAIVTAAHCTFNRSVVFKANKVMIVAGSTNLKTVNHKERQVLTALEIIVHPAYNKNYSTADLAIIKVRGFEFTEFVRPICLWGPDYDKNSIIGKEAAVAGFGLTEHNKLSDVLRSTSMIVQNDTVCVAYSQKAYTVFLNEFTFCAGYGPTSRLNTRIGDSGGGLVFPTIQSDYKIRWFLRGVVSKCFDIKNTKKCDPKYYQIYADIAPNYAWIYHHAGLQSSWVGQTQVAANPSVRQCGQFGRGQMCPAPRRDTFIELSFGQFSTKPAWSGDWSIQSNWTIYKAIINNFGC